MESFIPEYAMTIDVSKAKNIILAAKPADLRKGIDGYASLVSTCLDMDPTDGSLYLFTNRQKNKMKGILFDGNNYWLLYKRSASFSLKWPAHSDSSEYYRITQDQLSSLMAGLSIVPHTALLQRPQYV